MTKSYDHELRYMSQFERSDIINDELRQLGPNPTLDAMKRGSPTLNIMMRCPGVEIYGPVAEKRGDIDFMQDTKTRFVIPFLWNYEWMGCGADVIAHLEELIQKGMPPKPETPKAETKFIPYARRSSTRQLQKRLRGPVPRSLSR